MLKNTCILIGVLFILSRIWLGWNPLPDFWMDVYKDAAHVFVGGIGGAWLASGKSWRWRLFWSLNITEVAVAVLSRM
jgi:hypothetical protein